MFEGGFKVQIWSLLFGVKQGMKNNTSLFVLQQK